MRKLRVLTDYELDYATDTHCGAGTFKEGCSHVGADGACGLFKAPLDYDHPRKEFWRLPACTAAERSVTEAEDLRELVRRSADRDRLTRDLCSRVAGIKDQVAQIEALIAELWVPRIPS